MSLLRCPPSLSFVVLVSVACLDLRLPNFISTTKLQVASDCGRRKPTLGQCTRKCERGRSTRWLFTRDRAFFTPLRCPPMDRNWRWSFMSIYFMAKSALSLHNGPRPSKLSPPTHTHTHSVTPHRSCPLISKVIGLVKILNAMIP